jgi:hypothetical protein
MVKLTGKYEPLVQRQTELFKMDDGTYVVVASNLYNDKKTIYQQEFSDLDKALDAYGNIYKILSLKEQFLTEWRRHGGQDSEIIKDQGTHNGADLGEQLDSITGLEYWALCLANRKTHYDDPDPDGLPHVFAYQEFNATIRRQPY